MFLLARAVLDDEHCEGPALPFLLITAPPVLIIVQPLGRHLVTLLQG